MLVQSASPNRNSVSALRPETAPKRNISPLPVRSKASATWAMHDLHGVVALVTGASAGIGQECALELAGRGATVVLGVRSRYRAADTQQKIREKYPAADVVVLQNLLEMADPASIRAFAAEYVQSGRPLHILINNAGALTFCRAFNQQGVPELCQVNYLGPYLLTRLLEGVLVRSAPSRVVNVSSSTHRFGVIGDPWYDFLRGPQGHYYENTKLANVLHAYELQRRLGWCGVQACAVDPGSVSTDIWRHNPLVQKLTQMAWAPPAVGARPLVFAATVAWDDPCALPPSYVIECSQQHARQEQKQGVQGGAAGRQESGAAVTNRLPPPELDLRYFAPEAFATPLMLWYTPEGNRGWLGHQLLKRGFHASSLWGAAKQAAWLTLLVAVAAADWPVRQLSKGALWDSVVAGPSAPLSYDPLLAAQLWNASADVAGMAREPQIPPQLWNASADVAGMAREPHIPPQLLQGPAVAAAN